MSYYNTIDANPFGGYNYYRLKQIGVQGKNIYSSIEVVQNIEEEGLITIYPNPVEDKLNIEFLNKEKGGTVILYNNLGQVVTEPTFFLANKTILDVSNLKTGVYLLQIKNKDFTNKIYKVIKK